MVISNSEQEINREKGVWQDLLDEANDKPWVLSLLARHGAQLYTRFVLNYRRLEALPGRARQRWQRKLGVGLGGAALLLTLSTTPVYADNTITVNGTCTLVDAIKAANTDAISGGCATGYGADTIILNTDVTLNAVYSGDNGLPAISSNITIEGNSHTISRIETAPDFRIFEIDAAGALKLDSVTVSGGQLSAVTSKGGGIYIKSGALTLANSTLSGNSAGSGGGGIYNYSGTVTVLSDSTLSENSSGYGGGIMNKEGTVTVLNSTLTENSTEEVGSGGFGGGGGIHNIAGMVTVSESTLSKNSSKYYGGGIRNAGGTVTVSNSMLSENSAKAGGGIYTFFGTVTVLSDSTLSGNSAKAGGGIYNNSGTVSVLSSSTLTGNSSEGDEGDGGGIDNNKGTVTVSNSTLSGNSSGRYGGGIYNNSGTVTVLSDSMLSGNSSYDGGGGIENVEGTVTVLSNSTLSGNSSGYGGGIENFRGTVTVSNSTLSENISNNGGGGIENREGTVTVSNSTLTRNISESYGGGIENLQGTLKLSNSTLSENISKHGGGIDNYQGTVTVSNSTLSGNSAHGGVGGGIDNYQGTVTVEDSTLSENISTYDGGGIYTNSGTLTVENSTLTGNSSRSGGGIYSFLSSVTTIIACTMSGNYASYYGGGMAMWDVSQPVSVSTSLISGNSASRSGSEMYIGGNERKVTFNFNLLGHSKDTFTEAFVNFLPTDFETSNILATSDSPDAASLSSILDTTLSDNGGPTETHALVSDSPAIDGVTDTEYCKVSHDQRGISRPQGTYCDIGAVELACIRNTSITKTGANTADLSWENEGYPVAVYRIFRSASPYSGYDDEDPLEVPGSNGGTVTREITFTQNYYYEVRGYVNSTDVDANYICKSGRFG
ncbi:MAG: hypothetical protein GY753_06610, partial [Gammaproteobacteria bacterium]|nr:hypothetical protein [Gammaproteobacteria bacterium]